MAGAFLVRRSGTPGSGFVLGMRASRIVQHAIAYILIAVFLAIALMPLAWMFSGAFKTLEQMRITFPIQWIPNPVTLQNFADGWQERNWLLNLRNTLMLAVFVGVPTITTCTLAAYAFARMRFPGSEFLMFLNISLMLIPDFVTMVPRYVMMARMGWIGTWLPAVVPSMLALNPAMVFVLRQFFRAIPNELSEAARLDGSNELGIYWRVILPLSKPILALQIVLITSWAWNDLLFPLLYLKDKSMQTLTLAMMGFIGIRGDTRWGQMMAMSVLVSLPMMVLSYYGQRYFTEGFTLSGIKG
ncbi:MAG: carbohydrate ABC transporter permease [Caldilineaceae bacterium]|nr:carbohydrate ABC transporter permease [Caldilineaceae bacterium]